MRDFETNEKHAQNPEPGDFWHEMFCPILVVLEIAPDTVVFCRKQEDAGKGCWRWNVALTEHLPKSAFYDLLHYDSKPMKHKYWADVIPRGHLVDAEAFALSSHKSTGSPNAD